jgi:NAD(P) transhydrogenase
MVGRTEEELTRQDVPYEVGKAHYRELARGQIIGDSTGLLKLIFHAEMRQLLGSIFWARAPARNQLRHFAG